METLCMGRKRSFIVKRTEVKTKECGIYKEVLIDPATKRQTATGRYRSVFRFYVDGKPKKSSCVCSSFADARDFKQGRKTKEEILSGVSKEVLENHMSLVKSENEKQEVYTFSNLVKDWKNFNYENIEETTREGCEKYFKLFECLFEKEVKSFKIEDIDKLVLEWKKEASERRYSFKRELKFLGQVFRFYRERKNPQFIIPILSIHYKKCVLKRKARNANEENFVREEDFPSFLCGLKQEKDIRYHYVALCQYFLGLRIGEALGLHWEDLNKERMEWLIDKTIVWDKRWTPTIKRLPKNGVIRSQPISEYFLNEMEQFRKLMGGVDAGLVFSKKGLALNRKAVATVYNRVFKRVGIDYASGTHCIRRTAATLGNNKTGDYQAASHFLGHLDLRETRRYVGKESWKRKHLGALEEVLDGSKTTRPLSLVSA